MKEPIYLPIAYCEQMTDCLSKINGTISRGVLNVGTIITISPGNIIAKVTLIELFGLLNTENASVGDFVSVTLNGIFTNPKGKFLIHKGSVISEMNTEVNNFLSYLVINDDEDD